MFAGNENNLINLNKEKELTKNYRDAQSSLEYIKAEYFSKAAINSLMNESKIVGIRIYYCLDNENILTKTQGIGLINIKNRIDFLNGKLNFKNKNGVCFIIKIPIYVEK